MQMAIYLAGLLEKYPDNKSIKLSHYYVANHQTVSVSLSDINIDKFSDSLVKNIEAIEYAESDNNFSQLRVNYAIGVIIGKNVQLKKSNNPSEKYLR